MKSFNVLVAKSNMLIIVLTVLTINIANFPKEVSADIYVYIDEYGERHFTNTPLSGSSLYLKSRPELFLSPYPSSNTMGQGAGIEWEILNQEAEDLYREGNCDRGVIVAKKSLEIAEKNVGPNHPSVAASLNNLAMLYNAQGRYALAEPLYRRSLAIIEKALGSDHPDVALSLNNLAGLYNTQGQYALAEPLYKRSLAIREKSLGPDHPAVAASLNTLAGLYHTQGQYALAEPLCRRSLEIRKKSLDPNDPGVATILEDMAFLHRKMGEKDVAEKLEKRAAKIRAIKR